MAKLYILTGSTRPGRFNLQVAQWVAEQAAKRESGEHSYELVDIADANLPLLDESDTPMSNKREHAHSKAWADKIAAADGFLVISPEYNHSIPAALKNAFDYLFEQWNYKPISFVSYGSAAGGSRAVEHLRAVAGELKMYDLRDQLLLPNYWNHLSETGSYQFTEDQEQSLARQFDELEFWAAQMKTARESRS